MEEITTRDESNDVCTHGLRTTATGALGMDGPPTTFSGTGVDRMAFLQANVTRDNTEFVNGETIGDRCIFQVWFKRLRNKFLGLSVFTNDSKDYAFKVQFHK